MKKIILLIIVAIAVWFIFFHNKNVSAPARLPPQIHTLRVVEVIHLPKIDQKTDVTVPEHKTALSLLNETAKIHMSGTGTNAFITEINGVKANTAKKEYWAFYVNGKLADVGAGSYILKSGDTIEWKIETY